MSQPGGSGAGIPEMPPEEYPRTEGVVKSTVVATFSNAFADSILRPTEFVVRTGFLAGGCVSCATQAAVDSAPQICEFSS
jgi:hypothetical protein